jgi:hypothetical protein
MNIEDVKKLSPGSELYDNRTGEDVRFMGYTDPYALCDDGKVFVWLVPERLELK